MQEESGSINHTGNPVGDGRHDRPRDIHVLFLILLAFAVRLSTVLAIRPPFPGDGQVLDSYAIRIASGLGFGPSSSLPPLYPYFLGMLYRVYGYGPNTVVLSQSLIGSLTLVPVIALARLAGLGRREVLVAGFLYAVFPQAVAESRHLTPILLLSALISVGVITWLRRPGIPSIGESLIAGALLGGSILGRVGLVIPALILMAVRSIHEYWTSPMIGIHRVRPPGTLADRSRLDLWMRRGFLIVAGFCVIAPWAVRSSNLHGRSVFVESTWGLRLRAANVPDMPVVRYSIPGSQARAPDNMVLTENKIAFQEFLGYAATHPDRLAPIWASRIARFLAFSPISDSGSADPWPYRMTWFRILQALVHGTMLSLALSWLVLLRGAGGVERAIALLVLGFIATGVVSGRLGDARILSLPCLAVLAGRGLRGLTILRGVGTARRILFLCLLVVLWIQGLRVGGML